MDIADFAHGIFRGFAEGEISDYDSGRDTGSEGNTEWNHRADFLPKKTLLWSTFKKYFYMEKDTFVKKGVLFLCPDTVMLIREREEKIMKKGHCGKMLLLFGAACMLMTGCGTKESSKWIQKI